jgi:isopenicillin-N N-acyltransferase-like protein
MTVSNNDTWPLVFAGGRPFERGHQYGEQVSDRIAKSLEGYERIFRHYTGLSWSEVRSRAEPFAEPLAAYDEELMPELEGIAAGAGVDPTDILALNVRTEIMFGLRINATECTAACALPQTTATKQTLVGQNWDWKPSSDATCVVLVMAPDDGPGFVTFVEAGLLAKTGCNEVGLGVVTNALVSDQDRGNAGVTYHVLLRKSLRAKTLVEAVNAIVMAQRASSANYLLAHAAGEAINIEAAPGGASDVYWSAPQDGLLVHANHFTSCRFPYRDTGLVDGASSLVRHQRIERILQAQAGRVDAAVLQAAFADHFSYPNSICSHPDDELPEPATNKSVGCVVMNLSLGNLAVSYGPPCESTWTTYDVAELIAHARARELASEGAPVRGGA